MITPIELTVQFSRRAFTGTEESGSIKVTVDLHGGTASHDFNVSVTTSPVTATGELSIMEHACSPSLSLYGAFSVGG